MTNTIFNWIKLGVSALCGLIATFFQHYGAFILAVLLAVVFDFITGLIKAKMNGGWSSKTASKGFWKKVGTFAALAFGIFLDYFIPMMIESTGVIIPFALPFALVIACYIVINECISIAENFYSINPNAMPKWIVNLLKIAKENFEEKVDTSTEVKKE